MIELQTLVSDLTVEEFTKLCGMIGGAMFLLCFLAVITVYLIYCFGGIICEFIAIIIKIMKKRKKEKQEEENNADI